MSKSEAAEAVAGAYFVLHLLPPEPDNAEAIILKIGQVLAQPGVLAGFAASGRF